MLDRTRRGQDADRRGRLAEDAAAAALEQDGWTILARRLRTPAGEIDLIVEREGLLAIVEVKARPCLAEAAASMSPRQQARLVAATDIVLAEHPVDAAGVVRRISDAFRGGD